MNVGFCALCQKEKNLCRSHLIPKGLYKYVENDDKEGILRIYNGKATKPPGKGHITTPLLCKECEDHFSRAEKLVISQGFQNSAKFPLLEKLSIAEHKHPVNNTADDFIVFSSDCHDIDWNTYTYFALSIFWRFSVARNIQGNESYYNSLETYQDEIRDMLLSNNVSLPNHMYLRILVNHSDSLPMEILTNPSVKKFSGYHVHRFLIPNTLFYLFIGRKMHSGIIELRKQYGPHSIFVGDIERTQYGENLCKMTYDIFHKSK